MMAYNLTNESGYLNNSGRQRIPKRFDRNGLQNLIDLHQQTNNFRMRDKFDETGPSVTVQKVIDWSVSPPRKMKC